jgi:hypothetical protein
MKKITSHKKKLQTKFKENFLVCNKIKRSKFQTCTFAKKNAKGILEEHQYSTTRSHQQATTKQNIEALTSTKDQRNT